MNIKIHRGLEQIGGCITEIFTDTSRIFIDFGQNLPGCGKPSTPEEDENLVKTILSYNNKKHEVIFYSHGHEDHVGLFEYIPNTIPQYMSAGTKELLSIKYGLLSEGASLNVDELQKNNCSSEEYSTAVNLYTQAENKCKLIKQMRTWHRTAPQKKPESIMIGDI